MQIEKSISKIAGNLSGLFLAALIAKATSTAIKKIKQLIDCSTNPHPLGVVDSYLFRRRHPAAQLAVEGLESLLIAY